jgi:hypothetical protein
VSKARPHPMGWLSLFQTGWQRGGR